MYYKFTETDDFFFEIASQPKYTMIDIYDFNFDTIVELKYKFKSVNFSFRDFNVYHEF